MPKQAWYSVHMQEDEDGVEEQWEFGWRRPSTKAMLSFTRIEDASTDRERMEMMLSCVESCVRTVKCNGVKSSVEDMPFELLEVALGLHPSFRSSEASSE